MDRKSQYIVFGAVALVLIAGFGVVLVSSTSLRIALVFVEAIVFIAAGVLLAKSSAKK